MINLYRTKRFVYVSKRAAYSYFHPLKELYSIKENNKFLYDLIEEHKKIQKKFINIVSRGVCYNQGELIQYSFIAAERHKQLKDEFRKSKPNKKKLINLVNNLLSFLNKKFFEISYNNFQFLQMYFEGRSEVPPRICIKGNFKIRNQDAIVSVFRDSKVSYQSDCSIEQNSGFYHILTSGKYYLNNDLPKSFFKGEYQNPRLDIKKLEELKTKPYYHLLVKFPLIAENFIPWEEFWKDYNSTGSDYRNFYRSTLIIPMTLLNNKLSDEFKNKVNIKNVGKVIFGFLCFDHVEKNYFKKEYDVPIGYIFADLLSIFLFNRLVYTEISNTFKTIENFVEKNSFDEVINKISCIRDALTKYDIEYTDFLNEIKISTENQLFSIDDFLVKCAAISSEIKKGHRTNSST